MCAQASNLIAVLLCCALAQPALADQEVPPYRRPGTPVPPPTAPSTANPNARSGLQPVPPPPANAVYSQVPVDDRWSLPQVFGFVTPRWYDPYHQNRLKGDLPIHGDWFLDLNFASDSVYESRYLPTPVAPQSPGHAGALDVIGNGSQSFFNQNLLLAADYYQGDTTFRPPEYEFRVAGVFNYNHTETGENRVLKVDPRTGTVRNDNFFGLQEAFFEKHLRDVSPNYDFDALRIGLQPFTSDFRGFLFIDNAPGLRLLGTRDSNTMQYNIAWFRLLEKDTNSGLNAVGQSPRRDDVYAMNVYWQDTPSMGYTSQLIYIFNRDREGDAGAYYDRNGFLVRPASLGQELPRNYFVNYLGYNGDGHFGRLNLTDSLYGAFGWQDNSLFTAGSSRIRAWFAAAELSWDFDWARVRGSLLYASGDRDPYDHTDTGFDAIVQAPLFAGADTSFWIRQAVPLIGGGGVSFTTRDGILNDLRSSSVQGQSNFTNPGTRLVGIGTDTDLTPEWRLSTNFNQLWFDNTAMLETLRSQGDISRNIGLDASVAAIYRPLFNRNIIVRVSGAVLFPGAGYRELYGDRRGYSLLFDLILTY
ncbi:MAG: hypothetical protein ACRETO_08395 [Gammaproteobacteria bacterium]